jgi:hypothetical protein
MRLAYMRLGLGASLGGRGTTSAPSPAQVRGRSWEGEVLICTTCCPSVQAAVETVEGGDYRRQREGWRRRREAGSGERTLAQASAVVPPGGTRSESRLVVASGRARDGATSASR